MIPVVNLPAQYQSLKKEIDAAVEEVLQEGAFIQGKACRLFESEFASFCGVSSACGVANGSDALFLAVQALGIGQGDEVITTPFTFIATAEAISRNGARPVFADIDPGTMNLDPRDVAPRITDKTKAIIVVHLYGHPAAMNDFAQLARDRRLALVEDAAQAHGAEVNGKRAGGLGDVGCFSFYPTKNLSAAGDAGMVVANDSGLVARVRLLANHGEQGKYEHAQEGVSSRLDNLQAAILRVKLRHLETWNEKRRRLAEIYLEELGGVSELRLPREARGCRSVYHQFTVRTKRRDALRHHLEKNGIGSAIHYPRPLHLQPAYANLGLEKGSYPEAEAAAEEVLSLPIHPELGEDGVRRVAKEVRNFFV
ncbi:MAG TPA: DegT/DnrJ/EryC1/StrS family aminotransferase [Vicinamibacteria bacterium]|jgi:dTDP-4-amino-4,6-dideoxygalactose transaminase